MFNIYKVILEIAFVKQDMLYIHESTLLICHGNLKSSNCVVTSRWVLQVSDFGLHDMRHCAESGRQYRWTSVLSKYGNISAFISTLCSSSFIISGYHFVSDLFWKAPELLRKPNDVIRGTQKDDIYSFAIILYEVIGRKGPYGNVDLELKGNCTDNDRWLDQINNSFNLVVYC